MELFLEFLSDQPVSVASALHDRAAGRGFAAHKQRDADEAVVETVTVASRVAKSRARVWCNRPPHYLVVTSPWRFDAPSRALNSAADWRAPRLGTWEDDGGTGGGYGGDAGDTQVQ